MSPGSALRSRSLRAWIASAGTGVVALAALALAPAPAGAAVSGSLYVDPTTAGARWAAANAGDSRAAVIKGLISVQPQAHWATGASAATTATEVASYVSAAKAAGQIPQVVLYALPNRDCGGASSGGTADLTAYGTWVSTVAKSLGTGTALVLLEPDGIALQTCLSAAEAAARDAALATAVTTIKSADPAAKVYLDGGHSAWNSASVQASRLQTAGVLSADGFFTNVSNFQTTSAETAYGKSILGALGNPSALHQVIDTSRNGAGPGSGNWCDDNLPSTRRLGTAPTLAPGSATVDAYLWVKLPGEADGCVYQAGSFQPALAYSLAGSGSVTPPATTPPVTTPPVTTPPVTTPPVTTPPVTTPAPAGACTAVYSVVSRWSNGFQANVTVTAGSAPISGWRVTWNLASGQAVTQAWNATVTTSGSTVTAASLAYNGSLAAQASTSFGFTGSGDGSAVPVTTCTA